MAHAATIDLAAAVSAACLLSPNCAAVSAAASLSFSSPSPVCADAALSTSTSTSPPLAALTRSFFTRELTLPWGISPTSSPTRVSSLDSGTTSAFADGRANTRCFTRSASAAVLCPSESSIEPDRVMACPGPPVPEPLGLPRPDVDASFPASSTNEVAAAPKSSLSLSAPPTSHAPAGPAPSFPEDDLDERGNDATSASCSESPSADTERR
mmetsp:Transcript_8615/g.35317  ORF Transcript_8615/g.35317 Transcript_8615/m.35317 type:complete len:211 (-) Transcript_8615:398-1030(-)